MSGPGRPGPDLSRPPDADPAVDALLGYLASTAITPPPDLVGRVQARVDHEPDRTPPRRFLLAIARLRPGLAIAAFRQLLRVSRGQGRFPAPVRAQALALVLLTVVTTAALGVGAAVGVQRLVDERHDRSLPAPEIPAPTRPVVPEPSDPPSPPVSHEPIVSPSPPDDTPDATSRPPHPDPTPRPTEGGGTDAVAAPTRRPTPRPTHRPRATERPRATPRPTSRPRETERPEPTETPDQGDGSGEDGHGSGETEPSSETGMVPSGAAARDPLVRLA